jgi:hypothetical protein
MIGKLVGVAMLSAIVFGAAWMEWGKHSDCRAAGHSPSFCVARGVL